MRVTSLFLITACLMTVAFAEWSLPIDISKEAGSFPFIDAIFEKANKMAGDFAKDPCVQKVSEEMQLNALECLYAWKKERKLIDTINCGANLANNAKDKLKNECKIDLSFIHF